MQDARRTFLKQGSGLFASLLALGLFDGPMASAEDWHRAAFEAKKLDELMRILGATGARRSDAILINASEIAENGAVVPIQITSKLDKTQAIAYLVDKNPNVLAANFIIPEGTLPEIDTRLKMAQTSEVYALVKAGGKYYFNTKEIKITLGGCGG